MSDPVSRSDSVPEELLHGISSPALGVTKLSLCPVASLRNRLRANGLRPTRQRMLLGWLLFSKGDRHISADDLYLESQAARAHLSIATVYNTLNQFSEAGLLRKVATVGERTVFDTNTGDHHHFLVEGEGKVLDISDDRLELGKLPKPPPGYRIVGVDVVIRVEKEERGS
jgi:Fur family transcriptional regulator, iron response regulator